MKRWRYIGLFGLLVLLPCNAVWPAQQATIIVTVHFEPPETFYVDVNNTSGIEDGTVVNPFDTIGEGLAAAVAGRGDTVIVLPGLYVESVVLKDGVSLIGRDGSFPTLIGPLVAGPVVMLADDTILRGFSIGDGSAAAVEAPPGVTAEITNCVLHNSDIGLRAGAGAHIVFNNNTAHGNVTRGVDGAPGAIFDAFTNNIVTANGTGLFADPGAVLSGGFNLFFANTTDYDGPSADVTDFATDPLYVDPLDLNFHLSALSPARDTGDPDPAFDDLDASRNDLGADGGPDGVQDLLVPLAVATATPETGNIPLMTSLDGSGSSDEWGIASYSWDLDGLDGIQEDLTGAVVMHTYTIPGTYIVTLTVEDNNGFIAQTTTEVLAGNNLPDATASVLLDAGMPPFIAEFSGIGSDPDGGPVTFEWDFGDGNTSTEQNPIHTYVEGTPAGPYVVEFRVIDEFGGAGIDRIPITLSDVEVDDSTVVSSDTGGELIVDNPDSEADGTTVSIPPESLSEDVVITVGDVLDPPTPPEGSFGIAIDFGPDGLAFSEPITITIPHAETIVHPEAIEVAFFDTSTNMWSTDGIINVMHIDGSPDHFIQFQATHFTIFKPVPAATPPSAGGGGGGGCPIATAAYGTPLAEEIDVLRTLRDTYLLDSSLGAAFVDTYYRFSPPLADAVATNAVLRNVVRFCLVPIVFAAKLSLSAPLIAVFLFCMAAAAAIYGRRRLADWGS